MSDGIVSQDEIDALLSGVPVDGLNSSGQVSSGTSANVDTEVLANWSAEMSAPLAENLKKMTGAEFSVGKPVVETCKRDDLLAKLPEMVVAVMADFSAGLKGDHLYLLSNEFAQKLVSLMNKEENAELDEMALSVISEVVSTHTNDEITSLDKTGKISGLACIPPESVNYPKAMVRFPQNSFVLFSYPVTIDSQAYTLWEAVSEDAASSIAKALGAEDNSSANSTNGALSPADMAAMGNLAGQNNTQQQQMMPNMGMQNQNMGMQNMAGMGMNPPNVQSLQFPNLQGGSLNTEQRNISLIMDVYMELTVELGRTKKQIKDILGMGEGTIIELDKLAGEPVDILVNLKPIAKGEVVVVEENFGVRVTQILSPLERVDDLQ